jgi:nitrogenase molybdenum-iron protein alpha/beta subunit
MPDTLTYAYVAGVRMAVNAIGDAHLLIDAPEGFEVAELVDDHDFFSNADNLHAFQLANESSATAFISGVSNGKGVPLTVLASLEKGKTTPYKAIAKAVAESTGGAVANVAGNSGDWLDGYIDTLAEIAAVLDIGDPKSNPKGVAVVGNFHSRNEREYFANIDEMRRTVEDGLGLDLVSVWLAGTDTDELKRINEAAAIVSLPYGREAARRLAERLGVPLIECELPFGPDASIAFIEKIAKHFDCEDRIPAMLDEDLGDMALKFEFLIPTYFLHKHIGFVGDSHHLSGLVDMVAELGLRLSFAVITHRDAHVENRDKYPKAQFPKSHIDEITAAVEKVIEDQPVDLAIANTHAFEALANRIPTIEAGYPSFYNHVVFPVPYLFLRGYMAFLERLSNEAARTEIVFRIEGKAGTSTGN